jgi:hypothetical protein
MATDTHSEYVIRTAFHGNSCYANAPHYYIIHLHLQKYISLKQFSLMTDGYEQVMIRVYLI